MNRNDKRVGYMEEMNVFLFGLRKHTISINTGQPGLTLSHMQAAFPLSRHFRILV